MPKAMTIILLLCACMSVSASNANLIRDPGAENPVSIEHYPDSDNLTASCPGGFYAPGLGVYNGGCSMVWGIDSAEPRSGDNAVFGGYFGRLHTKADICIPAPCCSERTVTRA